MGSDSQTLNSENWFFSYAESKRKNKEIVGQLSRRDEGIPMRREKAELLNTYFALVFSQKKRGWRQANGYPVFRKGGKEDPGKHCLGGLHSTQFAIKGLQSKVGREVGRFALQGCRTVQLVCSHLEKDTVILKTQQRFLKNKPHQTHLIFFSDRITSLVDERNAVDIDFSKASNEVPHDILVGNLCCVCF